MEGITRAIVELFSRLRCLWSSPGPYPSSITAQEGSGEKANGRRSKLSNVTPPCKHRSQPRPEKSGPRYEGVFVVTHFFLLRLPCVFFFLGCFFLLFFFHATVYVSVRARCGTSVEREGERSEEVGRVDRGRTLVRRALVDPEGRGDATGKPCQRRRPLLRRRGPLGVCCR